MTKLLKNESILTVVAILSILAVGIFVIPFCINIFFRGLLFIFEKPMTALIYSSLFLGGMLVNEFLGKLEK